MAENKVHCPSCGAALEIDEAAAGKVIRCPECGVGLILSGEKNPRVEMTEAPKSSKSDKTKSRPRLAWGMGGVLQMAPARA
jgi:lysine biosynthesis protein LysW